MDWNLQMLLQSQNVQAFRSGSYQFLSQVRNLVHVVLNSEQIDFKNSRYD
jgi:hypothetical protein